MANTVCKAPFKGVYCVGDLLGAIARNLSAGHRILASVSWSVSVDTFEDDVLKGMSLWLALVTIICSASEMVVAKRLNLHPSYSFCVLCETKQGAVNGGTVWI